MARPSAKVFASNGNIGGQAPSKNGISGVAIATPAAPTAGYLTPFLVKSKKQAALAFANVANAPVLAAVQAFFDEAPEGTKLFIICAAQASSLTELTGATIGDRLIQFGAGNIRLCALVKFPANTYVPVITEGFDGDVHTAVTAAQTLANAWLTKRKPLRFLLQGYGFTDADAAKDYSTNTKRNIGILVGSIDNSTAMATMLALGRLAKEDPQRNAGRVKSGSLAIAETATVKIGADTVDNMDSVDLDTLHEKRYMTFEVNDDAPGYIFNDDNTLTDPEDDYSSFRNGRVMDNAVRIAYKTYYRELKDDVDVDAGGRLSKVIEKYLEAQIVSEIDAEMRGQLSRESNGSAAVKCLVNPDPEAYAALYESNDISNPNFNLLQAGQLYIFPLLRPKGCLKYIGVYLGYTVN